MCSDPTNWQSIARSQAYNSDSHPDLDGAISPDTARELADELEILLNDDFIDLPSIADVLNKTGRVGARKYNRTQLGLKSHEYMLHFAHKAVLKGLRAIAAEKIFLVEGTKRRILHVHGRRRNRQTKELEVLCSFLMGEKVGTRDEKWSPMGNDDLEWLPYEEVDKVVPDMVEDIEP